MIVLDCNAALAMSARSEEGKAFSILTLEGERIIAPDIIYAELTHALVKQVRGGYVDSNDAVALGTAALDLVDEVVSGRDLWIEAMTESMRLGHSSYDMLYFVLARREGSTLFTLDRKLQKLCLDNGVNCVFTDTGF
ncbi:toxin PIN [Gordonibacter sp. 28C]|uniref:type II toxin-antitoxin system VapC family toxin n=1 Tax=Gordonibacter sp. 28C TaxID=2078569 RepID=UPI000DF7C84C|nr:type II toxin-antitoxin system VapC family toxin [Gordonibacter sp. 28C]RDB61514.1 toxin PIN [Gordonibacter sp. 28C]